MDFRSLEDPPLPDGPPSTYVELAEVDVVVESLDAVLGRIAASTDPLPARALALLVALRVAVPFDAAWLAFADPRGRRYLSLASLDLDDDVAGFFTGPAMAHDIAVTGTDRPGPPASRSDRPARPAEPLSTWSECLVPAGIHESLSVALFVRGSRHVGFLTLLYRSRSAPSGSARRRLAALAPLLALAIDPMPCLSRPRGWRAG